jgi:thiazole synthase ThiGH ThiG subunit
LNHLVETWNTSDPRYLMPDAIETLRATEELNLALLFCPTFMLILFCVND